MANFPFHRLFLFAIVSFLKILSQSSSFKTLWISKSYHRLNTINPSNHHDHFWKYQSLNDDDKFSRIISLRNDNTNNDDDYHDYHDYEQEKKIALQRTLFKINSRSSSDMGRKILDFQIEEHIHFQQNHDDFVQTGLKTYILRGPPNNASLAPNNTSTSSSDGGPRKRMTRVGLPLLSLEINELLSSNESAPGTGSTTWDSSIAMCIFLSSFPNLLKGKVLELGSGVGIAGILSSLCVAAVNESASQTTHEKKTHKFPDAIESITFTDYSHQVMEICKSNAERYIPNHKFFVKELDWYDTTSNDPDKKSNNYNTVIGTDCAYLFPDVKPLAHTIACNLFKDKDDGKCYMVGPYNRDAAHYLKTQLEESQQMTVTTGTISMDAFQIQTIWSTEKKKGAVVTMKGNDGSLIDFYEFARKTNSKYLLIEATHHDNFIK